ncbi:MAG: hypothetical protein GY861_18395 [bacterium]|nr:hypothetical protein [bacterium]
MTLDASRYIYQGSIRSSAILTGSYVEATMIPSDTDDRTTSEFNQLKLNVDLTIGDLTSCEIKVEISDIDINTGFYQTTTQSISSGTTTPSPQIFSFTTDFNGMLLIPFIGRYVKVSAKGTGTATSSLLAITAAYGIK